MDAELKGKSWSFRLYIAGNASKSIVTLATVKRLCKERLLGLCRIEVIDLEEHPELAQHDQVVAIPTLIRQLPLPPRRITGALTDVNRALADLGPMGKPPAQLPHLHDGPRRPGARRPTLPRRLASHRLQYPRPLRDPDLPSLDGCLTPMANTRPAREG